jgi:hypothetical protein
MYLVRPSSVALWMLLTHHNFGATVNYPMPRCTFDPSQGSFHDPNLEANETRTVRFQWPSPLESRS